MKIRRALNTNGTSLKGYITTSYDNLLKVFGIPCLNDPPNLMEKVTTCWNLEFPCGTIATIYNWKNYGFDPESYEDYRWHIGGHTSDAVALVNEAFESFKE